MATGWMIGVMVELAGEPAPVRHFFAVAQEDQAKAEWTAVDHALSLGSLAGSPFKGVEPVQAIAPLTPHKINLLGLSRGQVRALGRTWPRRWVPFA